MIRYSPEAVKSLIRKLPIDVNERLAKPMCKRMLRIRYALLALLLLGRPHLPSDPSSPAGEQDGQIPLVGRLLDELVDRGGHAQTLAQLFRHDRQCPVGFSGLVVSLSSRTFSRGHCWILRLRVLHFLQTQWGQRPLIEWIVAEDVQYGHDTVRFVPQSFEGKLAAAPEYAFGFRNAHAVNQVAGQTERDDLGDVQDAALFESDAEIDVHHFTGRLIEQNILAVPVAQAEHMAKDGAGSHGACIREPLFKPDVWVLEAFHEEVAQDRMELFADAAVGFDALVNRLGLHLGDMLAAVVGLKIFGEVALVCR